MVTVADSIGIKLLTPDCLLAGVGNELHQYYIDSKNTTVHRKICLKFRCKIYGISKCNEPTVERSSSFVVVYGGRQLAILILSPDNHLKLIKTLSLDDWISSIQVYKSELAPEKESEVSFCVVSAHSVASEFKINTNGDWSVVNKAFCVDKCTLYSSEIIGDGWSEVTVFGGTAFGELIIWKAHGDGMSREVLQRLTGHNGVIFSINCSVSNKIITTTSDDRSVKIWKLDFQKNTPSIGNPVDWAKVSIEPSKSMFGHTARIFNHKIIEHNENVFIITVGEDGTVCIWSPDGRLINRQPIATNVSLWNCEYDPIRQYLYASGNDGNIHQLSLRNILNETQFRCENFVIDSFENGEYVEKLVIMQNDAIVILLTNRRKLLYGKIMDNLSECYWVPLPDAEVDYKITILETHGSLVATAGYRFITIYQFKNGHFNKIYHDQPPSVDETPLFRSLKFLTENEFVICNARGNGSIITIDESFQIIKDQRFEMPPSKERWITVVARIDNYLVVSDRHGNMHLYEINDMLQLKHTLWRVHGNLGCKSIFQIAPAVNRLQFECAGHQSRVKTIVINDQTQELELKSTHDIPIKWCDKALQINKNVLLSGFNERHFIAWRNDDSFRFEFDCGGGHRACDFHVDSITSKAYLFFVRSKLLNCVQFDVHDGSLHPFNISRTNWHSRPCNTMQIIELTKQRFLTISGGDDNLLKFSEINMIEPIKLKHDVDMVLHISNIRTVFSLRLSGNDTSDNENWIIFSAGGRAQICMTGVEIDQYRDVHIHEMGEFMLRSSDLDRKRTKQTQIIKFDPETRFMSLVAYSRQSLGGVSSFDCGQVANDNERRDGHKFGNEIFILVGCSDGFIRTFTYTNGSIALDTSTFYGRCFLNVHHFEYANQNYFITMATDGFVAFWSLDDFNEDSKPFFNIRHHDSGINSFDIFRDDLDKMVIATGGDDQAIVISILKTESAQNGMSISIVKTVKFPYNHTAQVNGLKFSQDKKYLYSASVDQTTMRIDMQDFSIKNVAYSCISDAKGLQIIDSNNVLVYGCGVQILNV